MPIISGNTILPTLPTYKDSVTGHILPFLNYPMSMLWSKKIGGKRRNFPGACYGMYVFKHYGLKNVICKYYFPYQPHTAKQTAWQTYYSQAVRNWQGFDELTKKSYRVRETTLHMSGYNRYLKAYLLSCHRFLW